jgi:hypothetical protein
VETFLSPASAALSWSLALASTAWPSVKRRTSPCACRPAAGGGVGQGGGRWEEGLAGETVGLWAMRYTSFQCWQVGPRGWAIKWGWGAKRRGYGASRRGWEAKKCAWEVELKAWGGQAGR